VPRSTPQKDLSLKSLELFQICAHQGSLQGVAEDTGLSVSTISHHLRGLESHLGVALFNHARRPMVLTPKGRVFLQNIEGALHAIRAAKAEASAGDIESASILRIGSIEDFDSDIIPELAVFMAKNMPRCDFTFHTNTSHAIIDMLRNRHLDLGLSGTPTERLRDLQDRPLLRDPFVVVRPLTNEDALEDVFEGRTKLPFLRFSSTLIIARQTEAHLKRIGVAAPRGFECDNNQTLMAMVAAGAGWAITTPLLYARAKRFQSKLRLSALPGKGFSRSLTVISTPDCSRLILDLVDQKLRSLISTQVIDPLHASHPWLKDRFELLAA